MLKELFGKALKCKNKKKEARRKNKLNRKKWKRNLLTVEIGALSKINKKEEENFEQEKLEVDLSFTLSIFFTNSE